MADFPTGACPPGLTEQECMNWVAEQGQRWVYEQQLMDAMVQTIGMLSLFIIFIVLLAYSIKKGILETRGEKILVGFFFVVGFGIGGIIYLIYKILAKRKRIQNSLPEQNH